MTENTVYIVLSYVFAIVYVLSSKINGRLYALTCVKDSCYL